MGQNDRSKDATTAGRLNEEVLSVPPKKEKEKNKPNKLGSVVSIEQIYCGIYTAERETLNPLRLAFFSKIAKYRYQSAVFSITQSLQQHSCIESGKITHTKFDCIS